MSNIRTAIIGCGPSTPGKGRWHSFGYAHGWAYAATPETTLVAAASRTEQNITDFCAEFPGVQGYQDYREMLDQERPELVSIVVHPHQREGMVQAALASGAKGIWLEKPFAESLGEARRLMEMTAQAGARLFINTQRRYGLPFKWMREAVADKIDTLLSFEALQSGTDLLGMGSHTIDTVLYALGDRRAMQVQGAVELAWNAQGVPHEKHITATIYLSDGARLLFEADDVKHDAPTPVFRANGSEGFAEIYMDVPPGCQSIFRAQYAGEAVVVSPETDEGFHHSEDPALYIKRACADITRAMQTGMPALIDAQESYRTLEILLGIEESARQRRLLPFPITQQESPLRLWREEAK